MADNTVDALEAQLSRVHLRGSGPQETKTRKAQKPNAAFEEFLDNSPFEIFRSVSDLGFSGWNPKASGLGGGSGYKELSDVTSNDIVGRIVQTAKPPRVKDANALNRQCPIPFQTLPPQTHRHVFPYDPTYASSLYVAKKEKKLDLDQVDFVFGGSALHMLATQEISDCQYLVTVVPTTKRTILVAKHKEYVVNYADPGFQFERLVTGQRMGAKHSEEMVEHLHVMEVGGRYKVLFVAETDGLDASGNPVEVKCSNPRYWGTKVMFQMMSSGSLTLYAGSKYPRNTLSRIQRQTLAQVTNNALQEYYQNPKRLEDNILSAMKMLQQELLPATDGNGKEANVFELYFQGGSLRLRKYRGKQHVLLPPYSVMEKLLA